MVNSVPIGALARAWARYRTGSRIARIWERALGVLIRIGSIGPKGCLAGVGDNLGRR